jgi:hypothetical protein
MRHISRDKEKMGQPDNQPKPIRIMLADDHLIVREGLVTVLRGEPDFEFVGLAEDGGQARQEYARLPPMRVNIGLISIRRGSRPGGTFESSPLRSGGKRVKDSSVPAGRSNP